MNNPKLRPDVPHPTRGYRSVEQQDKMKARHKRHLLALIEKWRESNTRESVVS